MKKLFKTFILFILCINFNQFTNAKPLPPGSGSGDVPANILILLDSSKSMNNLVGDGMPTVNSGTIVWNGDRVFSYNHKNHGGLYKFNSTGSRTNWTTDDYDLSLWWANKTTLPHNNGTTKTGQWCDYGLHPYKGNAFKNAYVTENRALSGVKFVTGVTVKNTNISNENLLFIGQAQPKNKNSAFIAIDENYNCRLAIFPDPKSGKKSNVNLGFDVSQNASGEMIFVGHGRISKDGFMITCNFSQGKCDLKNARGKGKTTNYGRLFDGKSLRLNSDSTMVYIADDGDVIGYKMSTGTYPMIGSFREKYCDGSASATGTEVRYIDYFDIIRNNKGTLLVQGENQTGSSVTIDGFNRAPVVNESFTIAGNATQYKIQSVTNNTGGSYTLGLDQSLAATPDDDAAVTLIDDIMYSGGRGHRIQRVEWDPGDSNTCTAQITAGKFDTTKNINDDKSAITPGTLAAADIKITSDISLLSISGTGANRRIMFSHEGHVDELTESAFVSGSFDTAWQQQFGGLRISRLEGAKRAIVAVLSDTTLTSGANFGYGHWNSGEGDSGQYDYPHPIKLPNKKAKRGKGGGYCHDNDTRCEYYGGWKGVHPSGTSKVCSVNSCLNVAISPEGASRAIPIVQRQGIEFGTDSEAFSQIAYEYFTGPVSPHDPASDCQLNYVIVIGDGKMSSTGTKENKFKGRTADRLTKLRKKGIKTLMVAYGEGVKPDGMKTFDELAVVGSCESAGDKDCESTIIAKTPEKLQTELSQRIRQILAERLAFTAPSITATIQEGGSLYQAQFSYEQYGEWQGTILRKTLNPDGTVEHDMNFPGNWSAAEQVRLQARSGATDPGENDDRNIWTVLEDVPYFNNGIQSWNNVNERPDNLEHIRDEMERLGYVINDYYTTSTSPCTGPDGTDDEMKGILRFIAGQDFFDYIGGCNKTDLRNHVLGDIYHSQLIEIGPPNGEVKFTDVNQEAYFRSINNYQGFRNANQNRRNILYAGSNTGLLHAFNAETGREEWAFLPPLLAGKLPLIINRALQGSLGDNPPRGGTNAIFGVDGSPVVHDVFMAGLTPENTPESADSPSWHTILFVPFGRGGSGFSVLDVTNPIVKNGTGPLHMFTVYNDYINNTIYITDYEGKTESYPYTSGSAEIGNSLEGQRATTNFNAAQNSDGDNSTTIQDNIAPCQSNSSSIDFKNNGTSSCYRGNTFTFDSIAIQNAQNNTPLSTDLLNASKMVGDTFTPIKINDVRMINGQLRVTFDETLTVNMGTSSNEISVTDNVFVNTSCKIASGVDPSIDYSRLGETWSTPRIVKLPSDLASERDDPANDKYVAIMGGGASNSNPCAGSALYMVELDNLENPGQLYGAAINGGPLTIIDSTPTGPMVGNSFLPTPNGSDIKNAIITSPVVITPDTAQNIPWRGAMVYINDREGKITKINLTDSTENNANLFDQTTLFRLNANTTNRRYSFFSMDAGIGVTTKDFWLFGGTGDFNQLGDKSPFMDNILYGIRDFDYPFFKHLNDVVIPSFGTSNFTELAHTGANNAKSIDDANVCADVTAQTAGCIVDAESAWVIHLDTQQNNSFRKASAPPTLFKGQVYFPVYEPPAGANRCNIGDAYICVADDECGNNNSHKLLKGSAANGKECAFVREGVLSELVVFGDKLFANVAGPSDDPDTLYSVLAAPGEVLSNRSSWRDPGF